MSYLQVQYVESVAPDGSSYSITFTTLTALGISPEIFVFATDGDVYDHVATTRDLLFTPIGRAGAEATTPYAGFYRVNTVTLTYPDKPTAVAASRQIQARINILNKTWEKSSQQSFGGARTLTYDSGDQ